MKKVLSILLACGLVLLCACAQTPDEPQNGVTGNYKSAVAAIDSGDYRTAYDLLANANDEPSKELLSRFVFVPTTITSAIRGETYDMHFSTELTYDKKGNPLKHVRIDKGDKTETVYTYDDNGRMIKQVATSDDFTRTEDYAYDAAGRLIRHHRADCHSSRVDETTYTYVYDDKGNLTEEKRISTYSDGDGDEVTTIYNYNETGKITLKKTVSQSGSWSEKATEYRADGTLYKVTERRSSTDKVYVNEYDEQERLWKEWVYPTDEEPYVKREYTYDKAGRVIKDFRFTGTTHYTYDEKGNLLCETEGSQKTTYTYDESGNCLTEARTGSVRDWSKQYTYDEKGNCLTDTTTYDYGLTENVTNTYDGDGNRLTQVYDGFSSETGEAITITENVAWTLFYYPDEIPELVEEELYKLTIPPNAA